MNFLIQIFYELTCRWSCEAADSVEKFSSRYNYYDGLKHEAGYLYPPSQTVLAGWKHTGRSRETLAGRSSRATSPLISRELDRSAPNTARNMFIIK